MTRKINVILSTFGPLHLIKSAEYLSPLVNLNVIQGWIPSWWNKWLLIPISKIIGYDLRRTIKKRTPVCLEHRNKGLGLPEFLLNISKRVLKNKEIQTKCNVFSYHLYGVLSKKYIENANIFHVRSGSGRGGAIQKAKEKGMKIIVDHSIAHPSFMDKSLKEEFQKNHTIFNMGMDNQLWKEIVEDCNEADILLVNSFFVKDTFIAAGYDEEKIRVAYLGVRKDFFSLKKNYTIHTPIKILFTGGFGFRKGAEYLLRAMHELEKREIKYECIIVGNNSEAHSLLKKYPTKHINLVGFVPQDDLKQYLAESDIYLFPSLCEGCASSGMEAMAAGLPVIATVESGLPIKDKENGLIVKSKNVDEIVESIIYLSNNESIRKSLGAAAAETIKNNYTWEQYGNNVYDIYQSLLS